MTKKTTLWFTLFASCLTLAVIVAVNIHTRHSTEIDKLIAKNIEAKGGADKWLEIKSLRISGTMDLGQGLHTDYVIEQKRPASMCLEYQFDQRTAVQCVTGKHGWKFLPFLGHKSAHPMSDEEANAMLDTASIDGLLFNSAKRGYQIELMGKVSINGSVCDKLKITMPGGTIRWLYLDELTGLEVKLESKRILRAQERTVETIYAQWKEINGLKFPARQETRTVGDESTQFITVENIAINPVIDDERFSRPNYGKPSA